jgi:hypothetical protein
MGRSRLLLAKTAGSIGRRIGYACGLWAMSSLSSEFRCRIDPYESGGYGDPVSLWLLLNSVMTVDVSPLSLRSLRSAIARSSLSVLNSSNNSIDLWPLTSRSGYTHNDMPRFVQLAQAGRLPSHYQTKQQINVRRSDHII